MRFFDPIIQYIIIIINTVDLASNWSATGQQLATRFLAVF
jgi:hypothetical protein